MVSFSKVREQKAEQQTKGNRLAFQGDRHFSYDQRGNLTKEARGKNGKLVTSFTYNAQNQLVEVNNNGTKTQYQYDALGRRTKKLNQHTQTEFLWNGDVLLAETQNDNQATIYFFEPYSFKPLAQIQNNEIYHYHLDHLGTPQELTKNSGEIVWSARYKTYGNLALKDVDDVENNLRFQGQYFDQETGLHYNRHRYYNPNTGQFTQQDPIGLLGGLNNYQYAPNPVGWVDPFGFTAEKEDSSRQVNAIAASKPDFYVGPSGPDSTLPSTGHRYMRYKHDDGTIDKYVDMTMESKSAPSSYIGFEKYDTGFAARDAFQIKGPDIGPDSTGEGSWSDARLRGDFDTLQLYEGGKPQVRVPREYGDKEGADPEPLTKAYPEYGKGGAIQLHADGKKINFDKVEIIPEK